MTPRPDSWIDAPWPGNPRVRGLFTSRQGGVSAGPYAGAGATPGGESIGGMNLGSHVADLFQLARLRLQAAGMVDSQVQGGGVCTVSNPAQYFAYRRDRVTGRQAGLVWIAARSA